MEGKKLLKYLIGGVAATTLSLSVSSGAAQSPTIIPSYESYTQTARRVAEDGLITYDEQDELKQSVHVILNDANSLVKNKDYFLAKIKEEKKKLGATIQERKKAVLAGENDSLQKKVLVFYPNLITPAPNIIYVGNELVKPNLQPVVREIVASAEGKIRACCQNDQSYPALEMLLEQKGYAISDLLVAHKLFTQEWEVRQIELASSEKISAVNQQISYFENEVKKIDEKLKQKGYTPENVKVLGNNLFMLIQLPNKTQDSAWEYSSFYSAGFSGLSRLKSAKAAQGTNKMKSTFEAKILELTGKKAELEKPEGVHFKKIPLIPWQPSPAFLVGFGLAFPFIRNVGLAYILRKKHGEASDYVSAVFTAGTNSFVLGLCDCLHPLVYPIRVFATPFVFQPLRKMFFGDKSMGDINDSLDC